MSGCSGALKKWVYTGKRCLSGFLPQHFGLNGNWKLILSGESPFTSSGLANWVTFTEEVSVTGPSHALLLLRIEDPWIC